MKYKVLTRDLINNTINLQDIYHITRILIYLEEDGGLPTIYDKDMLLINEEMLQQYNRLIYDKNVTKIRQGYTVFEIPLDIFILNSPYPIDGEFNLTLKSYNAKPYRGYVFSEYYDENVFAPYPLVSKYNYNETIIDAYFTDICMNLNSEIPLHEIWMEIMDDNFEISSLTIMSDVNITILSIPRFLIQEYMVKRKFLVDRIYSWLFGGQGIHSGTKITLIIQMYPSDHKRKLKIITK